MSHVPVHRCGCLQPMGSCKPCIRSTEPTSTTIRVVHLDGVLEEFDAPITVGQIIGGFPKHFMTTPIQLMHGLVLMKLDALLEPGRIYFVLPYSILRLNESSKDLMCLAQKLTSIAKAHRSKPKPKPKPTRLASSPEKGSSQDSNPCIDDSSRDLSLAKEFTSIVRDHRSKPNRTPSGSPQDTRSSRRSNPRNNDQRSRDLIRLANKLRSLAKAAWSKPRPTPRPMPKPRPRPTNLANSQERGSSQGSDPSTNEENSNINRSTKMLSWKPLLATIREISFNRRESDLSFNRRDSDLRD
ncbi:hypothetical protein Lser_V15G33489 [Lactuca serriola]